MKFDRGMIKWQPFDSVMASGAIKKALLLEKAKLNKPELSEEEITLLEEKIITAYYCQSEITIHYYKDGYIKTFKGKIKKIDHITKMIYFNNSAFLFNQIISID